VDTLAAGRGGSRAGAVGVRDGLYHLPRLIYACRTDGGIVFLDARRDRYFGLGGAKIARLADLVVNLRNRDGAWADPRDPLAVASPQLERVANTLIQRGLLCHGSGEEARGTDVSLPPPEIDAALHEIGAPTRETETLSPETQASYGVVAPPLSMCCGDERAVAVPESRRSLRPIDVANFVMACLRASWSLRWFCLGSIAARVTAARVEENPFDFEGALRLVRIFQTLRCWGFSEKNRCLFNALSLVYFLQRYGHFPYFVIGVKTTPFAAHSWVQRDRVVLDGNPATVGHFVPILVA
jgi:hypothetical protein